MEEKEQKEIKNLIPLSFLTMGIDYLRLVSNVLKENIKQGNSHMIISDVSDVENWD